MNTVFKALLPASIRALGPSKLWLASLGLAAVFLSGCASMSESECLTADWHDQGYRDGRDGFPRSRIEDHRSACAKVGIRPDAERYFRGREQGIVQYCTPRNGYNEGIEGRPYRRACPAHLERQFLRAYEQGKRIYDAEQQVEKLEQRSSSLESQLRKEKDKDKRHYLRQQLRDLDRELRRARDERRYIDRRQRY